MVAIPSNRVKVSYVPSQGIEDMEVFAIRRNPLKSGQGFLPDGKITEEYSPSY